jgi:hypothetical protein
MISAWMDYCFASLFVYQLNIRLETRLFNYTFYFITTLTLNFHSRLPLATGAIFYNIGQTSIHPRLKPRLSQDILNL